MRFSAIITFAVVAVSGALPTFALDARAPSLSDIMVQALKRADLDEGRYAFDPTRFRIGTTVLPTARDLEERTVFNFPRPHIGTTVRPGSRPFWPMGAVAARDDQPQAAASASGDAQSPRPLGHHGGPFGGFAQGGPSAGQVATSAGNFGPGEGPIGGFGGRPHGFHHGHHHHHHHPGGNAQAPSAGATQPPTGQTLQAAGSQQPSTQSTKPVQQPAPPVNARSWASRRASTIYSVNNIPYHSGKPHFILP